MQVQSQSLFTDLSPKPGCLLNFVFVVCDLGRLAWLLIHKLPDSSFRTR